MRETERINVRTRVFAYAVLSMIILVSEFDVGHPAPVSHALEICIRIIHGFSCNKICGVPRKFFKPEAASYMIPLKLPSKRLKTPAEIVG